jgi:hypothetical protein
MATKQSKNQRSITIAVALIAALLSFAGAANAADKAKPRVDYFGAVTSTEATKARKPVDSKPSTSPGAAGAESLNSVAFKTPEVICFERFDDIREQYLPTPKEGVVINRSINKQAERLQEWIEAARNVAKEYKTCAKTIRAVKVPKKADDDDIVEFRDLTAEWYEDASGIFTAYVTPRRSARTIEELQREVDGLKKRQVDLRNQQQYLAKMEEKVRREHGVHRDINTDALTRYLLGKK